MLKCRIPKLYFIIFVSFAIVLIVLMRVSSRAEFSDKMSRIFEFTYSVSVRGIPNHAKRVEIWIPVPQSNARQKISDVRVTCEYPFSFTSEPEFGNRMLYVKAMTGLSDSMDVNVRYKAIRKAIFAQEKQRQIPTVGNRKSLQKFLQSDSLVPIDKEIAQEASEVIAPDMTGIEKVLAIYNHLVETLKYDKTGVGGGRGDAVYACKVRRGNCTDFHSLFIGMVRSCGIPARFIIGFPLSERDKEGDIPGYHCWAEFYIEGRGWIPVDVSEANKHPERQKFYFGNLDANRLEFTVGRDIQLQPAVLQERLNYFIYPYVLVDGKSYDKVNTQTHFAGL